ncbi:MAG: 6-bladed beta-propeller [Acidobacteriota bacterium]|nr:6-bladed beta-propeller [Acidobacteriota bacterium]
MYPAKNLLYLFLLSWMILMIVVSCRSKKDQIPVIINSFPIYGEESIVEIEKLYRIDVTQISLFNKQDEYQGVVDFDKNNNLYVLDRYEGTITVFDEKGILINRFGRRGQGPNEFQEANFMVISHNHIYVFQGINELKILDLQGEHTASNVIYLYGDNPLRFRAVGDLFYVLKGKTDRTFTKLDLLLWAHRKDFSGGKELFRYTYPLGLRGYPCWEWMLILESGEFFYPEDNHHKYSITRYDKSGKPDLIFGRKYQIENYSEEARNRFLSTYQKAIEKGQMTILKAPPIVRTMFQDSKENIWVISGETYEDNMNPNFKNTIDIFNRKGEWLSSFNTSIISKNSFYNHGKIYKVLPIDAEGFSQFIDVYGIRFKMNP